MSKFANIPNTFLAFAVLMFVACPLAWADIPACSSGQLGQGTGGPLLVTGPCTVVPSAKPYNYTTINILANGSLIFKENADGGTIDFWTTGIIVERGGQMTAGSAAQPFGMHGGKLTINLYGPDQGPGKNGAKGPGAGIPCRSTIDGQSQACGIPSDIWTSNITDSDHLNPAMCNMKTFSNGVTDCFYQYKPLEYDSALNSDPAKTPGYFGYKVLGVSYGGTLQLFGYKGADYKANPDASDTGVSWRRLTQTLNGGEKQFTIDWPNDPMNPLPAWTHGDQIVITSTDYIPGHAEVLTIDTFSVSGSTATITVQETAGAKYPHYGQTYDLSSKGIPEGIGPDQGSVDTRAAVALLTRSIRILSKGGTFMTDLAAPGTKCANIPDPKQPNACQYFGGHVIFRQGFQSVQVQGVEFYQMGQGARIAHYPVHFHMARQAPPNTFVKDSSVWDSMTRWYVLHGTQGVMLARNVGYLSIGHGYYIEDGSETDNQLHANIGIMARAAIDNPQNPRKVPGILSHDHLDTMADEVPFHTDAEHPSVFWIMNGWNDFEYNMAAGATACGMCYWFTPGANSGPSRLEHWTGYPAEQEFSRHDIVINNQTIKDVDNLARAGITPLKTFLGNSCVSAENSFTTIGNTAPCKGITNPSRIPTVPNDLSPAFPPDPTQQSYIPAFMDADGYYPKVAGGGSRRATQCSDPAGCHTVNPCAATPDGKSESDCMVTVLDHYTTSFNWADTNLSALWLRPQWYLVTNSAITDVQNGGLTFVSGGGYTYSDEIPGYWALAHKNAFIGNTQPLEDDGFPANPFASNAGPFNPKTLSLKFSCDVYDGAYCPNAAQGLTFPKADFAVNQRLFNIYDGPSYEQANAYLDVTTNTLKGCDPNLGAVCAINVGWYNGSANGVPIDSTQTQGSHMQCYLPNAAIAWKQPNGFYYPPAFRSDKLFFDNVEIRHFVIEPLFTKDGMLFTDENLVKERYCNYPAKPDWQPHNPTFDQFTDIDRQTELTDEDGSLTGLLSPVLLDTTNQIHVPTISVNKDRFFNAPIVTPECASDVLNNMQPPLPNSKCAYTNKAELCATANTSPYEYVSTVIFPGCGSVGGKFTCDAEWAKTCTNQLCFGVPLWRENLVMSDQSMPAEIRMAGQETGQRSTLTVSNGVYYMDITPSDMTQNPWACKNGMKDCKTPTNKNVFQAGQTYYLFLLYAKPAIGDSKATSQTYQFKMPADFAAKGGSVMLTRVHQGTNPPTFDAPTSLPTGWWDGNTSSGLLTLKVDMSADKLSSFATEYSEAKQNHCGPATYCTWNNGACGCAHGGDPECSNACSWAGKDISCPEGGCYGVAITLPSDFMADDSGKMPPAGSCLKSSDTNWNTPFTLVDQSTTGEQCHYTSQPMNDFCQGRFAATGWDGH